LYSLEIVFVFSPTLVLCLTSAPVSELYSFVTLGSAVSTVEVSSLVSARPAGS
jgi:hypothetical protein